MDENCFLLDATKKHTDLNAYSDLAQQTRDVTCTAPDHHTSYDICLIDMHHKPAAFMAVPAVSSNPASLKVPGLVITT
jgi:hypothetical protein